MKQSCCDVSVTGTLTAIGRLVAQGTSSLSSLNSGMFGTGDFTVVWSQSGMHAISFARSVIISSLTLQKSSGGR
jgi:hypothetical protein